MHVPDSGRLLVISGPSGAGKTSICRELLKRLPRSRWSVSVTTRPQREGEQNGSAYHFVSQAAFDGMVSRGELLEHATYLGHSYGTPRGPVDAALRAGETIILEIDVQGAAQVKRRMPHAVCLFIMPPSSEALQARLAGRKTESRGAQERRLAAAEAEIEFARSSDTYHRIITNDTIQGSVDQILEILAQEQRNA